MRCQTNLELERGPEIRSANATNRESSWRSIRQGRWLRSRAYSSQLCDEEAEPFRIGDFLEVLGSEATEDGSAFGTVV